MGSQQLATISESHSQPCEQRKSLLRRWLGLFALNAGQPLDGDTLSVYMTLWLEGFADLSDDVLEAAFQKTLRTCKFWPVKIADVREHIESAKEKGFTLESEEAWEKLLSWVERNYYPDLPGGVRQGAPRLPAVFSHAARAAGGYAYIERCSRDELLWARKTFLAAYRNVHETGQVENLLSDGDAKRILTELRAGCAPKRLVLHSAPAKESSGEKPKPEEVRAVLIRAVEETPIEVPSEQELTRRRERLLRQLEEWKRTHDSESEHAEVNA